ncbi:hypothetical protein L3X38_040824 [Prunus dulcis]|uniref:Uncharacterized protein n=1 Tax=Prunus dulcis TaxID=3755 RepID=A0AAD4UT65_PRUDU|nr:hypothetical protein L3X38_040824 [Prunus dulcis]
MNNQRIEPEALAICRTGLANMGYKATLGVESVVGTEGTYRSILLGLSVWSISLSSPTNVSFAQTRSPSPVDFEPAGWPGWGGSDRRFLFTVGDAFAAVNFRLGRRNANPTAFLVFVS